MSIDFNSNVPYICPYCEGEGMRESMDYDGDIITFKMCCERCQREWDETFSLNECEKSPRE